MILRRAVRAAAALLPLLLAACGGDGGAVPAGSAPPRTTSPAAATPVPTPSGPAPTPGINVRPPGQLDAAACRDLIVDFDDRLAQAYAAGDTGRLDTFLAGVELSGHRATIQQLNAKHLRNIFHVKFDQLSITSSTDRRVVFTLNDHTTDNHFVDTTTNQVVNQGLPGPATQSFTIFFDYNPQNQTWYWTSGIDNKR
ncbi:MAG TPA: hypothetical protein VH134_12945 [Candidatus Dormibacteraeota bacterium]|nr:hypothetical protein [Candidatus Dormibacteraeota bacterium]